VGSGWWIVNSAWQWNYPLFTNHQPLPYGIVLHCLLVHVWGKSVPERGCGSKGVIRATQIAEVSTRAFCRVTVALCSSEGAAINDWSACPS
jgi:hypothetical protein